MLETKNFDQLDSPINKTTMDKNSAIYFIDENKHKIIELYSEINKNKIAWEKDYDFKKYIKLSLNVSEIIAKINPEAYNYIFADTNLLYAKYIKKFNNEYAIR